jgi:hypothetical protein
MAIMDTIKKGYESYKSSRAEEKEVDKRAKEEARAIEAKLRAKQREEQLQERYDKIKNQPYVARERKAKLKKTIISGAKKLYKSAAKSGGGNNQPAFGSDMGNVFGSGGGFGGSQGGFSKKGFDMGNVFGPEFGPGKNKKSKKSSNQAYNPWRNL